VGALKSGARLISYVYPSREKELLAALQEKRATVIGALSWMGRGCVYGGYICTFIGGVLGWVCVVGVWGLVGGRRV